MLLPVSHLLKAGPVGCHISPRRQGADSSLLTVTYSSAIKKQPCTPPPASTYFPKVKVTLLRLTFKALGNLALFLSPTSPLCKPTQRSALDTNSQCSHAASLAYNTLACPPFFKVYLKAQVLLVAITDFFNQNPTFPPLSSWEHRAWYHYRREHGTYPQKPMAESPGAGPSWPRGRWAHHLLSSEWEGHPTQDPRT